MIEFQPFPKIPRYRREVAVSEKIDGTNAAVVWVPLLPGMYDANEGWLTSKPYDENVIAVRELFDQHGVNQGPYALLAQSRQRFITPAHVKAKNDNYGFAQWVSDHAQELAALGPGAHFGEWWGYGIQRGYGMPEKVFSLFNYARWTDNPKRPECCRTVPLLGYCKPQGVDDILSRMRNEGSVAAPGYQRPEGIVIFHSQSRQLYKVLLENDDEPKGKAA